MPLRLITGFKFASTAGWATGTAGQRILDVVTGTPTINTTGAPDGTACLVLSPSAATQAVQWDTNTIGTSQTYGRACFRVKIVGSLPTASTLLAAFMAGLNVEFRFNSNTNKFAANFETNALVDGGSTVNVGQWYHIEIYSYIGTTGSKTIDWWIDGVQQTQVTNTGTADSYTGFIFGSGWAAQTYTAHFTDLVVSTDTVAITAPTGMHKVKALNVDGTGSLTLSGFTATNLNTYSGATPTLSSWSALVGLANIADMPVNTLANQDGIAIVSNTPTNTWYIEIPMTSYTLQSGESASGARVELSGWQAAATSANCGVHTWNGTTDRTITATTAYTALGNNTANPAWICGIVPASDLTTQTAIDNLAVRFGYSSDANPDIGMGAVLIELAVQESTGIYGVAALSGGSTLTAVGTVTTSGVSALSSETTLSAAGTVSKLGVTALSSESSLTCTGTLSGVSVALSGQSTLTVVGTVTKFGISALSGQSTETTVGTVVKLGASAVSAQSTLTVVGAVMVVGVAALSSQSTLTATGTTPAPSALLTSQSSLTVVAVVITSSTAALSSQSTLVTSATVNKLGTVALSAQSGQTVVAIKTAFGIIALSAQSTLTATGTLPGANALLTGTSTLVVVGKVTAVASAALISQATMTTVSKVNAFGVVTLNGQSSAVTSAVVTMTVSVALGAQGILTADGNIGLPWSYIAFETGDFSSISIEGAYRIIATFVEGG